MSEAIITGIFGLGGALIGSLGTLIATHISARRERNRNYMRLNLEQIKSFYNLEALYIAEIERLRNRLPDEEGSKKANGIKVEFRSQNEENGNDHIEITAREAERQLHKLP